MTKRRRAGIDIRLYELVDKHKREMKKTAPPYRNISFAEASADFALEIEPIYFKKYEKKKKRTRK